MFNVNILKDMTVCKKKKKGKIYYNLFYHFLFIDVFHLPLKAKIAIMHKSMLEMLCIIETYK